MAKKEKTFRDYLLTEYEGSLVEDDAKSKIKAIPTGSISLDFSTGVGGIPISRFTEMFGPESSAKTTLMLSTAKQAIAMGKKTLYIDAEHTLDYSYVNAIVGKVSPEDFVLVQNDISDDVFTISEKAIASGEFNLIVLDSVANLVSQQEHDNPFEKDTMGKIPRELSKFLRRNSHAIRDSGVAYVFINQVRDKIGAYVPTLESPGGHALRHSCSLRISLSATSSKTNRIMRGEEEIGVLSNFSIKKNKLASPFKSFYIPIIWGMGIDSTRDLVSFSENLGVIKKAGAWYKYTIDGVETNIGQGEEKTIEFLKDNPIVLDKIKEECYTLMHKLREERSETDDAEIVES